MSSKPKPNLSMFTATKGNASAAPLSAPMPLPTPANGDQVEPVVPAEPKPVVAPVAEIERPAAPKPVRKAVDKPAVEAVVEDEDMVPLGVRSTREFRTALKIYAATIGMSMQDVVLQGIELHRQKHVRKE